MLLERYRMSMLTPCYVEVMQLNLSEVWRNPVSYGILICVCFTQHVLQQHRQIHVVCLHPCLIVISLEFSVILDFNVCFHEIARALHHMPAGISGYYFFFMLSLC